MPSNAVGSISNVLKKCLVTDIVSTSDRFTGHKEIELKALVKHETPLKLETLKVFSV
jgi:hypothetical protein